MFCPALSLQEAGGMNRNRHMNKFLANGRVDFLAGLAVVLPVAVSIAVVIWLFGAVSRRCHRPRA